MLVFYVTLHLATACNGCDYPDPVQAEVNFFAEVDDSDVALVRAQVNATLAPKHAVDGVFAGSFDVVFDRTEMQLVAVTLYGPDGPMAANLVPRERVDHDSDALAEEWAYGADVTHDASRGPFALAPASGAPGPALFTQYSATDVEVHVLSPEAFGPDIRFHLDFSVRGTRSAEGTRNVVHYALPDLADEHVAMGALRLGHPARAAARSGRSWPVTSPNDGPPSFTLTARSPKPRRGTSAALQAHDSDGTPRTFVDARYFVGGALRPAVRPVTFVFVFDASASLTPERASAGYALARRTMAAAPKDSVFAAVRFARRVEVPVGPWQPRNERAALTRLTRTHKHQNGSAIAAALAQATRMAADAPTGTDVRIVVFSDFRQTAFASKLLAHSAAADVAFVDMDHADLSTPLTFDDARRDASDDPRDALADGAWVIAAAPADATAATDAVALLHDHLVAPLAGAVAAVSVAGTVIPPTCVADPDGDGFDDDSLRIDAYRTWHLVLAGTCDALNHRRLRVEQDGALTLETWRGVHRVTLPRAEAAARTVAALALETELSTAWSERLSGAYGLSSPQRSFFVATPWRAPRRAPGVEVIRYGCGGGCGCIGMRGTSCVGCGWNTDASPHPEALVAALNDARYACRSDAVVHVDVADGEILDVFSTDPTQALDACVRERVWKISLNAALDPGAAGIYRSDATPMSVAKHP